MPEEPTWIDSLRWDITTDIALSATERERRESTLRDIAKRVRQEGEHEARPHSDRARQFMPFAALKGYHDMAHQREHVSEPKQTMTEERAAELSRTIARLSKGNTISVVHYETDHYTNTCGVITEINEALRTIRIIKKAIDFDDILSIEIMKNVDPHQ